MKDEITVSDVKALTNRICELEGRIRQLNQLGISLSAEHDLNLLLENIVLESRRLTDADAGSLYIIHNNNLRFEVAQNDTLQRRLGKLPFKSFTMPLATSSVAGYVALTGETLNIEDIYQISGECEFKHNPEFDRKNNYRSRSMLVVPMCDHESQIIGVIQLINKLGSKKSVLPFDKDDEEIVLSLASQAAVSINNARLIKEIKTLLDSIIEYSASLIDARSKHTAGHSKRVVGYTMRVAEAINDIKTGPLSNIHFTDEELEELRYAAFLHDIGKIGVREYILDKQNKLSFDRMEAIENRFKLVKAHLHLNTMPELSGSHPRHRDKVLDSLKEMCDELDADLEFIKGVNIPGFLNDEELKRLKGIARKSYPVDDGRMTPLLTDFELENLSVRKGNLTDEERELMEGHVQYSMNTLKKIPFPNYLCRIPLYASCHHEKLDGSGYPNHLKAEELPIPARILAVVDIFDAVTAADRPYKPALPLTKALQILDFDVKDGRLDKDIVRLFKEKKLYEGILKKKKE